MQTNINIEIQNTNILFIGNLAFGFCNLFEI